jgi:hypothetical protein
LCFFQVIDFVSEICDELKQSVVPNLLWDICSSLTKMLHSIFMTTKLTQNEVTYCETWVPMGPHRPGPRGACQVDPTCQKLNRPAGGPRDLICNPGDLGRLRTTLSRSQTTYQACGASLSLDHGGGAASRPEDRGILFVIMEGDLPENCNRPRWGSTNLEWKP